MFVYNPPLRKEMRQVIAELHNKISQNGSNLSDRLEDQLTGDFFGSIRYLPFEIGLKPVLVNVRGETICL